MKYSLRSLNLIQAFVLPGKTYYCKTLCLFSPKAVIKVLRLWFYFISSILNI